MPFHRAVYAMIGMFALLTALGAARAAAQVPAQGAPPYIESSGYGERRVAPDRATVNVAITTKAESAAQAASDNARIQQRVLDTLQALGLAGSAASAGYSVNPNFEPDADMRRPRQSGYIAHSTIRVRLSDLKLAGRVIDASLARGATGVEGVFFETSTAEASRRAALADAGASARADAEALARTLGGSLGALISVSTNQNDPRMFEAMRMRGATSVLSSSATQIAPSEIVIAATVLTRWQFVPNR